MLQGRRNSRVQGAGYRVQVGVQRIRKFGFSEVASGGFFEGQKRELLGACRMRFLSTFVLEVGGTPLGGGFYFVWNQIGGAFY